MHLIIPQGKRVFLNHSRLLALPFIGTVLYKFQYYLYKRGVLNSLKVSRRFNPEKAKLLKLVSKKSKYTISRSEKFTGVLKKISNKIIIDFTAVKNLSKLTLDKIYQYSWNIILSDSVTTRTKKSLGNFLPKNIIERKIIVVPYNWGVNILADYVFQTVKELAKQGHLIYLVPFNKTRSIFKPFSKSDAETKTLERRFKEYDNVVIHLPLRVLPLRFGNYHIVKSFNKFSSILSLVYLVNRLKKSYLWFFDWQDAAILRPTKNACTSLYDCADFWTSLDKERVSKIKKDEEYLIKNVDFFFANSIILFNLKKKIRVANSVVPQGFDLSSYEEEDQSPAERAQIKKLKSMFNKIPKPIVGYVGSLNFRLDFVSLIRAIEKCPDVSFVFRASPEKTDEDKFKPELDSQIIKFLSFRNVYIIPKTDTKRGVKEIIKHFDVGIIPYDINYDFNRYCYPMKLFEYFYMGKPVVSTPIEELKRFQKFVKIGKDGKEWERHIKTLLSRPWPKEYQKQQRRLAEENSWEKKVGEIIKAIMPTTCA